MLINDVEFSKNYTFKSGFGGSSEIIFTKTLILGQISVLLHL